MKTVAVLGARGRLGHVVATTFAAHGYRVVAVTRNGNLPEGLDGMEARAADGMDRQALIRACEGVDIVFNGLNPLYPRWARECEPMAENVMEAAAQSGALHLFPGNVYNYGSPMPRLLAEDTPQAPSTRKGAIRQRMELIFEREARAGRVRTIVLRAGDFFGTKGTGSWFDLILTARLARGVFTYPGPRDLVHAWAYLPDLAEAFVRLAATETRTSPFEALHFPGHALTGAELGSAVETAVGRRLKPAGVPWPLIRLAGLAVPMWREVAEMRYLWHEPHRLASDRLERLIGAVPHTPTDAAVRQALADLGRLEGESLKGRDRQPAAMAASRAA